MKMTESLKYSKSQKDQFEYELSQIINKDKLKSVLKSTEQLKFPPIDNYKKRVNSINLDMDSEARVARVGLSTARLSPLVGNHIL